MRIDLHTHSSVSDGTDLPDALVRRAARAGLSVLALTDHDTFDGWPAAAAEGAQTGVVVVGGVEMSTTFGGTGVHLLGYLPDPTYPPLVAELARIREDRTFRLHAITRRLTELGVPISTADVLASARHASTLGRPHIADVLVARGHVRDRQEAFDRWLGSGGLAYVRKYAPATTDAIALIRSAGGVAVLAHPWGRDSRRVLDPAAIAGLAAAGLAGLEVDHLDHDQDARDQLRGLAGELDLVVTGSSDHHGAGKAGHDLGAHVTAPDQYERLLDVAAASARAAGRAAPGPTVARRR